jgi:hypothetical protein
MKIEKVKITNKFSKFSSLLCLFAAILTISSTTVTAQKETPPAGGQPKPFVFPKQDTYTLPNGMRVTLVQYGTIPKVAVQAVVRAGHINEKAEQNWISDVTATMLKEGTTTRSAEQIARETAEMGGSIFTSAATDSTTVGGEVLTEFDSKFVALLSEVARAGTCSRPGRKPGLGKVSSSNIWQSSVRLDPRRRRNAQKL